MRTNKLSTDLRYGNSSDRGAGAPLFRVFGQSLSLFVERLSTRFWFVAHEIYACPQAAGARANPQGLAGHMTGNPEWMNVDAAGKVPSLGTDQARRRGWTAS